jgi:hypothetical protein
MKVEDGVVMGTVKTDRVGSECEFEICSVEEWKTLTEEEQGKLAIEAMWGSGMIEVWW